MLKFKERVIKQDLSSADLELEANIGEGYKIRSVGVANGAANQVASLVIGGELISGLPCDNNAVNVVPVRGVEANNYRLIEVARKALPILPFWGVAPGEKLVLSNGLATGVGYVFYEHYTEGDVPKKADPGGSKGPDRLIVSHGKFEGSITASVTEEKIAVTSLNPTGLPDFPFGQQVPSNETWELIGFATTKGAGSHADISYPGIRIWKRNQSILALDEAWTDPNIFPYNRDNVDVPYFTFPEPFQFLGNEEQKIEFQIANANVGAQTAQIFWTGIYRRVMKS